MPRPKIKTKRYKVLDGTVAVKWRNYSLYCPYSPGRLVAWADWKERRINV